MCVCASRQYTREFMFSSAMHFTYYVVNRITFARNDFRSVDIRPRLRQSVDAYASALLLRLSKLCPFGAQLRTAVGCSNNMSRLSETLCHVCATQYKVRTTRRSQMRREYGALRYGSVLHSTTATTQTKHPTCKRICNRTPNTRTEAKAKPRSRTAR